jgi:6-phosphogluconolactonase
MRGFLGAYTEGRGGRAKGIYSFNFNTKTGKVDRLRITAESANPEYLALSPSGGFLYATNEIDEWQGQPSGAVSAFSVDLEGNLSFINQVSSGGKGPCHIALAPPYAVVSNYTDGSISTLSLNVDGSLSAPFQTISLQEKNTPPEQQSHAHCFAFDNSGKSGLLCDLGADKIYRLHLPHNSRYNVFTSIPKAGPRHIVLHPSKPLAYVANELNSTVDVLDLSPRENARKLQTLGTLPETFPANTASAIKLSADARFLYISNRGRDSIAVFKVQENGLLEYTGSFSSGGRTPRDFALVGGFLLACHQDSDNLVVFHINGANAEKIGEYEALSCVCVVIE